MSDLKDALTSAVDAGQHPVILAFPGSGTTFVRLLARDWIGSDLNHENWNDDGPVPYYNGAPMKPKASITFRVEEAHKRKLGPFLHLVRHPMRTWQSAYSLAKKRNDHHHAFCDYLRTEINFPRCEGPVELCMLRALVSFTKLVEGLHLPTYRVEDLPRDADYTVNPHVAPDERVPAERLWDMALELDAQAASYLRVVGCGMQGYGMYDR